MSKGTLTVNDKTFLIDRCVARYKQANSDLTDDYKKELSKLSDDFITLAHKNMFEGERQKIYEKIPNDWFKLKHKFYVHVDGLVTKEIWHEDRVFKVPYPYHGYSMLTTRVIDKDNPMVVIADKYQEMVKRNRDYANKINNEINALRQELRATLSPYRTKKQLKEGWPELFALLPQDESAIKLPALTDLNARIGL